MTEDRVRNIDHGHTREWPRGDADRSRLGVVSECDVEGLPTVLCENRGQQRGVRQRLPEAGPRAVRAGCQHGRRACLRNQRRVGRSSCYSVPSLRFFSSLPAIGDQGGLGACGSERAGLLGDIYLGALGRWERKRGDQCDSHQVRGTRSS